MTGWSFLDVSFTYTALRDDMDAAYHRVMQSGLYIGRPEVEQFEAEFAQYCGAAHCVGVANGLDALVLALKARGIGAGNEVIVPANTFIATWLAVAATGFSFYPGKNLGAFGDGGAVVTDDPAIADAVRMLGNHGARKKYHHEMAGGNSRLDPLQAAFLRIKLGHIPAWNRRRQEIAALYDKHLLGAPDLTLPQVAEGTESVWHLYVLRHPARDRLREALHARGVPTALHYPVPNHHSGAFATQFQDRAFPVTEDISATCLSLPIGPHLGLDDAAGIAKAVRDAAAGL